MIKKVNGHVPQFELCECGMVPKYHCDAWEEGPVSMCVKRKVDDEDKTLEAE